MNHDIVDYDVVDHFCVDHDFVDIDFVDHDFVDHDFLHELDLFAVCNVPHFQTDPSQECVLVQRWHQFIPESKSVAMGFAVAGPLW